MTTLEPDDTSADCGATVPPKKKRRRTTKRSAQRAQHKTLYHAVAAFASAAWGRLVESAYHRTPGLGGKTDGGRAKLNVWERAIRAERGDANGHAVPGSMTSDYQCAPIHS